MGMDTCMGTNIGMGHVKPVKHRAWDTITFMNTQKEVVSGTTILKWMS